MPSHERAYTARPDGKVRKVKMTRTIHFRYRVLVRR